MFQILKASHAECEMTARRLLFAVAIVAIRCLGLDILAHGKFRYRLRACSLVHLLNQSLSFQLIIRWTGNEINPPVIIELDRDARRTANVT